MLVSLCVVLSWSAVGVLSGKEDKYKKAGGEAVLTPASRADAIYSVTWKHGPDIAVEWYKQETVFYRNFKGRCTLNTSTGALTISNLTLTDSGRYTAEINNKFDSTTEILVISAVPKPTPFIWCHSKTSHCVLTCEANVTDNVELITYEWRMDDWVTETLTNQLNITKENRKRILRCGLKNPVSHEYGQIVMEPFTKRIREFVIIPLVLFAILFVGFLFFIMSKCRKGETTSVEEPEVARPLLANVSDMPQITSEVSDESSQVQISAESTDIKLENVSRDQEPSSQVRISVSSDTGSDPETSRGEETPEQEPHEEEDRAEAQS